MLTILTLDRSFGEEPLDLYLSLIPLSRVHARQYCGTIAGALPLWLQRRGHLDSYPTREVLHGEN